MLGLGLGLGLGSKCYGLWFFCRSEIHDLHWGKGIKSIEEIKFLYGFPEFTSGGRLLAPSPCTLHRS